MKTKLTVILTVFISVFLCIMSPSLATYLVGALIQGLVVYVILKRAGVMDGLNNLSQANKQRTQRNVNKRLAARTRKMLDRNVKDYLVSIGYSKSWRWGVKDPVGAVFASPYTKVPVYLNAQARWINLSFENGEIHNASLYETVPAGPVTVSAKAESLTAIPRPIRNRHTSLFSENSAGLKRSGVPVVSKTAASTKNKQVLYLTRDQIILKTTANKWLTENDAAITAALREATNENADAFFDASELPSDERVWPCIMRSLERLDAVQSVTMDSNGITVHL